MEKIEISVDFLWDDEARVWVATSQTVPGLVLESESFDMLVNRVKIAVPELLSLNGIENTEDVFGIGIENREEEYV